MGFFSRLKNFFTRNRQEEETKREQKKWWQFWKRKPSEPEEGEIMPEEEEAPWRVDSAALMKGWEEKQKRKKEEEEQKKADEEKKRQQYKRARDTANKRYGTNFTEDEYDKMWDTYGTSDLSQYFPSDVIIYAAEFAKQSNIPFSRFAEILKEVAQSAAGQGWNREEAAQQLWSALDREASKYNEERSESYYDDLY